MKCGYLQLGYLQLNVACTLHQKLRVILILEFMDNKGIKACY